MAQLSTSMDLEKSFGPIYSRGLLKRGQSGFAVVGVNRQELQSSIDTALTFGILWLDVCRQARAAKLVVEGLKLVLPAGCSALVRERTASLNPSAAKWELYELEERSEDIKQIEVSDRGNISTRLVHCAAKPTKTFNCQCKGLTTGRAWPGIMGVASFRRSDTLLGGNCHRRRRC